LKKRRFSFNFFWFILNMMENPRLLRLELLAPLVYAEDRALKPFLLGAEGGERLFLFEIDTAQGLCFEPDPRLFLGPLIFSGRAAESGGEAGPRRELPAGSYLFAQERRPLGREDCIGMAIEVQKDGLWERLRPEPRLYLRYLVEDGRRVTQIFRPYRSGEA
jgi:hypothetical protein